MNSRRLAQIVIPLLVLVAATLACGPTGNAPPSVTVVAPPNGSQVAVGQTVEVLFRAEDDTAVAWVQMAVDDAVVATQQSPLDEGQTPLEGVLRWTPSQAGTFNLVLTARDADNQDSGPAAVSITVVEAVAGAPTPTTIPTPGSQAPAATKPSAQATQPAGQATKAPTRPAPTQPSGQATQPAPTQQAPAQPTATATATQQAPAQPTPTPTATTKPPTPIPPPEIVSFTVDDDDIDLGDTVLISWETRNAAGGVFLDGVQVDPSNTVFDNPTASVVYRLVAKGASGANPPEVSQEIHVQVSAVIVMETDLSAPYVPNMSGSVRNTGGTSPNVFPGDDSDDLDYEGFMTFNIGSLPANAQIVSAYLNLGPCETRGDPAGLGQLHVTNLQYGDLDSGDYAAGGAYIVSVDPCTIFSIDVTDRVEAMKAEMVFQVRLYFDGSDYDGVTDDVSYTAPTLDITYTLP